MKRNKTMERTYIMIDKNCSRATEDDISKLLSNPNVEILKVMNTPQYEPEIGWFNIKTYCAKRK